MGGISRVRLPDGLTPSVCILIRTLQKLPLIVDDGVVEAIREQVLLEGMFAVEKYFASSCHLLQKN